MAKARWLKVEVSYREGDEIGYWNSIALGSTEMVLPIEGPETNIGILADNVLAASYALVTRSEQLVPAETPVEAIA